MPRMDIDRDIEKDIDKLEKIEPRSQEELKNDIKRAGDEVKSMLSRGEKSKDDIKERVEKNSKYAVAIFDRINRADIPRDVQREEKRETIKMLRESDLKDNRMHMSIEARACVSRTVFERTLNADKKENPVLVENTRELLKAVDEREKTDPQNSYLQTFAIVEMYHKGLVPDTKLDDNAKRETLDKISEKGREIEDRQSPYEKRIEKSQIMAAELVRESGREITPTVESNMAGLIQVTMKDMDRFSESGMSYSESVRSAVKSFLEEGKIPEDRNDALKQDLREDIKQTAYEARIDSHSLIRPYAASYAKELLGEEKDPLRTQAIVTMLDRDEIKNADRSKMTVEEREITDKDVERNIYLNMLSAGAKLDVRADDKEAKERVKQFKEQERISREKEKEAVRIADEKERETRAKNSASQIIKDSSLRSNRSVLYDAMRTVEKNPFHDEDMRDRITSHIRDDAKNKNGVLNERQKSAEEISEKLLANATYKAYVDEIRDISAGFKEKTVEENAAMLIHNIMRDDSRSLYERSACANEVIDRFQNNRIPEERLASEKNWTQTPQAASLIRDINDKGKGEYDKTIGNQRDDSKRDSLNDDKKKSRPIGDDPRQDAKEEARNSKKIAREDPKEIYAKCEKIYEEKVLRANHHTDDRLSQEQRDIVQKGIQYKQELIAKNNEQMTRISRENLELTKQGKEIPKESVERLGKIERKNLEIEQDIRRYKFMTSSDFKLSRELARPFNETREQMKKSIEEHTIYPDPSNPKLFHFREEALAWQHHPDHMQKEVYDACLYSATTGRVPSGVAGHDITTFLVRGLSIPVSSYNKVAMESRHSSGFRQCVEIFKIDGRKIKPNEVNNACAALDRINRSDADERLKQYQRVAVADMCRQGQIANIRMTDDQKEALYQKAVALGRERSIVREPIKEGLAREREKDKLRTEISRIPEKTDKEIARRIITSKEKIDIQTLKEISRDARQTLREQAPKGKDGKKGPAVEMEEYKLSKEDLRQIVCGANPEILSKLDGLNIKLPDGVQLNTDLYNRAIDTIRGTNEKNDVMKMAMVNAALSNDGSYRSLDGQEGRQLDAIERRAAGLVRGNADMDKKHEYVKEIRQALKDEVAKEREERKEAEKHAVKPINYMQPVERILNESSHMLGAMCRQDDYKRSTMEQRIQDLRNDQDGARNVAWKDYREIHTRERGMKPEDMLSVLKTDPRMLLPIQRAGIYIGRNGAMNEGRLKETIAKIEQIPKDEMTLRVAVLEKNYVKAKNGSIHIENPINMDNKFMTRDAKNLAVWMYARENNLKFREPTDIREVLALRSNISKLKEFEAEARYERDACRRMARTVDERDLMKPDTYRDVDKNLMPLASLAMTKDYEANIRKIVSSMEEGRDEHGNPVYKDDMKEQAELMLKIASLTTDRAANTKTSNMHMCCGYDRDGNRFDVNVLDRLAVLRTIELERNINGNSSIMSHFSVDKIDRHDYSKQSSAATKAIEDRAYELHRIEQKLSDSIANIYSGDARIELIHMFIDKGYDSDKITVDVIDSRDSDIKLKAEFLVESGYGTELGIVKDSVRDNVYVVREMIEKSEDKITDSYERVKRIASTIRDNNAGDGKTRMDDPRGVSLDRLANDEIRKDAKDAYWKYMGSKSELSSTKENIPKFMVHIDTKNHMPEKERVGSNVPSYDSEWVKTYLTITPNEDDRYFGKIDKFYPCINMDPHPISAQDALTIMENREAIAESGVMYTLSYPNEYQAPILSVSNLNMLSVSNMPEPAFLAIIKSCTAEQHDKLLEMRRPNDTFKEANYYATAYQRFAADFNRNNIGFYEPDFLQREHNEVVSFITNLYDARYEFERDNNLTEEEKINMFAVIEFSRQQVYDNAPMEMISEATRILEDEYKTSFVTPEHSKYANPIFSESEERSYTEGDIANDVMQRLGIDRNGDLFEILELLKSSQDEGLITDEESAACAAVLYDNRPAITSLSPEEYLEAIKTGKINPTDEYEEPGYEPDYEDSYDRSFYPDPDEDVVYKDEDSNGNTLGSIFGNIFAGFSPDRDEQSVISEDELNPSVSQMYEGNAAFADDTYGTYDEDYSYSGEDYEEYMDPEIEEAEREMSIKMAEEVAAMNAARNLPKDDDI